MAYEEQNAIRQLALNTAGWTDVNFANGALPIDCNCIVIINLTANDILMRTNPNVAASQVTIAAGGMWTLGGPNQPGGFRYRQGCNPPCSLQATTGTPNVIIESQK
jgi:hypothetical protein